MKSGYEEMMEYEDGIYPSPKKLNLGCGRDLRKGYINVDMNGKADVNWNLDKFPYPFKDNTFDEILALNIIEHLNNPNEAILEINRIAKNGCKLCINGPYVSNPATWWDLTHKRPFNVNSFDRYKIDQKYGNSYDNYKILNINKMILSTGRLWRYLGVEWLINKFPNIYEALFCFTINVKNIYFEMEIVKNKEESE